MQATVGIETHKGVVEQGFPYRESDGPVWHYRFEESDDGTEIAMKKWNAFKKMSWRGKLSLSPKAKICVRLHVPISDVEPLKCLPPRNITTLSVRHTQLTAVGYLSHCKHVKRFNLNKNPLLSDLSSLGVEGKAGALQALMTLHLNGTAVCDLAPLEHLPNLTELRLGECPKLNDSSIKDISRIKWLQVLYINKTKVRTLWPLLELTKMYTIVLDDTEISSLEPLRRMKELTNLLLSGTEVVDLLPLRNLHSLECVDLSRLDRHVDLGPIKNLPKLLKLCVVGSPTNIENFPELEDCIVEERFIPAADLVDDVVLTSYNPACLTFDV